MWSARSRQEVPTRFDGKVAVVTGGASGISAATVERLAAEGARVALLDIDVDRGAAVEGRVRESGG